MTETALALAASRAAHKSKAWAEALDERLRARELDTEKRDPAWLEDALAPPRFGIGKQYHRIPGKTLPEVAALHDLELEMFFRQQLGDTPNPVMAVSSQLETRVLVPEQWQTQTAGVTPCTCGHREDEHDDDETRDCLAPECGCVHYAPAPCRHAFETTGDKSRRCVGCGEVQHLVQTMALEETLAFKQLQNEQKGQA